MSRAIEDAVQRLRHEFDVAFTRPLVDEAQRLDSYLLARAGDVAVALRIADVRRVGPCPAITPMPAEAPALLGIANVRGVLVAMYGLAALLGLSRTATAGRPWFFAVDDGAIGLVVDRFEGQVRLPGDALRRAPSESAPTFDILETPTGPRSMVDVAGVVRRIAQGAQP